MSRTEINKRHEAKRQAKFKAKRESGNAYKYTPNPFKKGSHEWVEENNKRIEKAKSSRPPYAVWTSTMAKLENELAKAAAENFKKKREKKEVAD